MLRGYMSDPKTEIPYGTLDLLVLKTLEAMGPLHGFGIARRIERIRQSNHTLDRTLDVITGGERPRRWG